MKSFYSKTEIELLIEKNVTNGLGFKDSYRRMKEKITNNFFKWHLATMEYKTTDNKVRKDEATKIIINNSIVPDLLLPMAHENLNRIRKGEPRIGEE